MPEQDAGSFNVRLFFAGDSKFIIPVSVGDLPLGTEGRIDAIKGYRKIKIKNNIREIGELEFVMALGQSGQNPEYDYVYDLSGTVQAQDVYYQLVDLEENIHHEWKLSNCTVARGTLTGTDHASKAQSRTSFTLCPHDIEKV